MQNQGVPLGSASKGGGTPPLWRPKTCLKIVQIDPQWGLDPQTPQNGQKHSKKVKNIQKRSKTIKNDQILEISPILPLKFTEKWPPGGFGPPNPHLYPPKGRYRHIPFPRSGVKNECGTSHTKPLSEMVIYKIRCIFKIALLYLQGEKSRQCFLFRAKRQQNQDTYNILPVHSKSDRRCSF